MTTQQADPPKPLDQPLDLLHYVYLLFDAKWLILGGSIAIGFLTMQYSKTLPEIYQGVVKVDIIEPGDPGGVSPENRSGGESSDLIETGFSLAASKDNHEKVTLARLRSRKFTRYFLDKHNIYSLIYPDQWNNEKQQWKEGFVLDRGLAFKEFGARFRGIEEDEEAMVVLIKMRSTDPLLAAELANLYAIEFNNYMRDIALTEIEAKITFLKKRLHTAKYIQLEQMLYRLIETEEAAATIARGEESFALEILDPAVRAYKRFSPARKKMTIMATAGSAFLLTFGLIALEVLRQMKSKLDNYSRSKGRKRLQERKLSIRGNLLRLFFFFKRRLVGKRTNNGDQDD